LPLVGDLRRITDVLVFADDAGRQRAGERLLARATTVETPLARAVSWDEAAQAFISGFETELGLRLEKGDLSESEARRAGELVEQKYNHPSWTQRV
jgi:lipoate-protein ligase A